MSKKSYKERNGTTRVGDALRWLVKQGKNIAPSILDAAGSITGIDSLKDLAKQIDGSTQLSEADKELLLEELRYDMLEMQETTKRWVSDNQTDSYLTRNIRPLALAFMTLSLFIYIILDSSLEVFEIAPEWIDLLSSLLLLIYGGYFGMRSAEKITKNFKK